LTALSPFLDLVLACCSLIFFAGEMGCDQVWAPDGVARGRDLPQNFGVVVVCRPIGSNHRLGAFIASALSTAGVVATDRRRRSVRPPYRQESNCCNLQEAEAGTACGVDHDNAADAERIGLAQVD